MILWTWKLLKSVRQAIAGRKHPSQLAWAVAFGLLLGIVPHGNLLAVAVLLVVLSLQLNHAMAALTAIASSFAASYLDPYSDELGRRVLEHPEARRIAAECWQYPLVPWTDLNNTVVLGSFLIGLSALLPSFLVTYPLFRWLAPRDPVPAEEPPRPAPAEAQVMHDGAHRVVLVDRGHRQIVRPHRTTTVEPAADDPLAENEASAERSDRSAGPTAADFLPLEESGATDSRPAERSVTVETRIDVIRLEEEVPAAPAADQTGRKASAPPAGEAPSREDDPRMDEALNYLLRQLRDSQQRNAA